MFLASAEAAWAAASLGLVDWAATGTRGDDNGENPGPCWGESGKEVVDIAAIGDVTKSGEALRVSFNIVRVEEGGR